MTMIYLIKRKQTLYSLSQISFCKFPIADVVWVVLKWSGQFRACISYKLARSAFVKDNDHYDDSPNALHEGDLEIEYALIQ